MCRGGESVEVVRVCGGGEGVCGVGEGVWR